MKTTSPTAFLLAPVASMLAHLRLGVALLPLAAGLALEASAQGDFIPRVSWFTVDGGGAFNSAGGGFRISGTIGQPDAGTSKGGALGVAGGFWSAILPINPRLRITVAGPNVLLAWPDPSTGFRLEEAAALPAGPGSWSPVAQTPSVVGDEKQVTLPPSANRRFYRLARP